MVNKINILITHKKRKKVLLILEKGFYIATLAHHFSCFKGFENVSF